MSNEKSYWKDRTLWDKKVTVDICQATLQPDYDEPENKLAHMLIKSVIHVNNGWWYKEENKPWGEDAVSLHVGCNDIFAWGCADSEDITYKELDELYDMWTKDETWGAAAWCIKKRKQIPQAPVEKDFRLSAPWNLDELIKGVVVLT